MAPLICGGGALTGKADLGRGSAEGAAIGKAWIGGALTARTADVVFGGGGGGGGESHARVGTIGRRGGGGGGLRGVGVREGWPLAILLAMARKTRREMWSVLFSQKGTYGSR